MISHVESSPLVVISWWSNCLALACLHCLLDAGCVRPIYVVQAGKSPAQRQRFRQYLPPQVKELLYPICASGDRSRVMEAVVHHHLPQAAGVWFLDHDVFMEGDLEPWLQAADFWMERMRPLLCLPGPLPGPAVTAPAVWLSPRRWPAGLSFDPIPFQPTRTARRPDLYRSGDDMAIPVKDVLVHARDELAREGLVIFYSLAAHSDTTSPMSPFPEHVHLGGLFLFAGPQLSSAYQGWTHTTVESFARFYAACPAEWVAAEDPVLLRRLDEFREATSPL